MVALRRTGQNNSKPLIQGKKEMLCVWWNSKGLVYFEALKKAGVKTSRCDYTNDEILFDNACPHVSYVPQQKIEELGWEVLPEPPNSPDLAHSDLHLFRSMNPSLAEKHFERRVETEKWVVVYFGSQPVGFFHSGPHFSCGCWR
ncbi:unnamed protein product [Caenorhabditis nigoni]